MFRKKLSSFLCSWHESMRFVVPLTLLARLWSACNVYVCYFCSYHLLAFFKNQIIRLFLVATFRVVRVTYAAATMAPGIEFTLSLGHIPLITFTLRQWHFHFNDRLALPSYSSSAVPRRTSTPEPPSIPNGFHRRPLIEIRFAL